MVWDRENFLKQKMFEINIFDIFNYIKIHCLGWEDPLEEGMATHSNVLAWRIPWTEKPGRLPSIGLQRVGYD